MPFHPFIREALLNLDVSLPHLNLNAMQSLVVLWVLYRLNRFPDLTIEEFRATYAVKNSPTYNNSYYFQSVQSHLITSRDESNKTWKEYWFWARGSWKASPQVLEEFKSFVSTTWNLGKQCVEPARVSDEGLQCLFRILEMPEGRRHCQALTQLEVLHFVGWLPYRTSKEFDEYPLST